MVWSQANANRRIFSAIVSIVPASLAVKGLFVVKDLVVAYKFGVSDALDAYLLAMVLPSFAINIVAGSFGAALMPVYIAQRERHGLKDAQRLFSSILVAGAALLGAVCVLLGLAGPALFPWLAAGFSADKLQLMRGIFFALIPVPLVSGLSALLGVLLNASGRFRSVSLAPILTPILTVLILLTMTDSWGIHALVGGTVAGVIAELGLIVLAVRRAGFALSFRWYGRSSATQQVLRQYVPAVMGSLMMASTEFVDMTMAAMLAPGSVSALTYGSKVTVFLLGLSTVALGTAALPHFSQMAAERNWKAIRHTLYVYGRLITVVTIPAVALFIWWSPVLVQWLFERGSFGAADTKLVSDVQVFFLPQIPFYLLAILGARMMSALSLNRVLVVVAVINFLANVIGNLLLARWFGVAGIALSTSLVYLVSCALIYGYLYLFIKTNMATSASVSGRSG